MSRPAVAALPSEPMKGFKPHTLDGLHGRLRRQWAVWRLRRWCRRIAEMPESDFAAELVDSVVTSSPNRVGRGVPLSWLYRAMRDAAAISGPLRAGLHTEHCATYRQPLNARLAAAIPALPPDRHALLALFMYGARCEDIAKWEGASQEDVADRVSQIVRELSARVFSTAA